MFEVRQGDCLDIMRTMDTASIDAIVTDPPYGLGFMGKAWDKALPDPQAWVEALRVLKPGGHALIFGAPRLYHRLAVQVEDAGFEIRDCLMWLYGSGFPKSLNVSKAIDAQVLRGGSSPKDLADAIEQTGQSTPTTKHGMKWDKGDGTKQGVCRNEPGAPWQPATPAAQQWDGWGTALKPAWESVLLARKPIDGTVARNVLKHGVGGLNVDGCRVAHNEPLKTTKRSAPRHSGRTYRRQSGGIQPTVASADPLGRWPANLILDEEAGAMLGEQARFFYCPKASRSEREAGLARPDKGRANTHPTVKPIALMRYLCRLITPPGGLILDPFAGSGSTGCAAVLEGFRFVGCELDERHAEVARARIAHHRGTLWRSEMS